MMSELTKMRVELDLRDLSAQARDFMKSCPEEAERLARVAIEVAAASGARRRERKLPPELEALVIEDDGSNDPPTLSVTEAATRLGITRQTVYGWIEKGILLAWGRTKAGKEIPEEQILGPGEVVPAIAEVLKAFESPRAAWEFLDELTPFLDEPGRPIEALKRGEVDMVLRAARSCHEAFT